MENKRFIQLAIVLLLSVFCSGCGTFIGTTIHTTVNPDFNLDEYKTFDYNIGDEVTFISRDVEHFMDKNGLKRTLGEGNHPGHEGFLVFLTGHCGFSLPPAIGHVELIYTNPRVVSIEIQDAVTKKQLLLCVYQSGFFSMCSYPECRKMIIDELKNAFERSKQNIQRKSSK